MITKECKGVLVRIFIVGCPRSGTTLLQSILAGHNLVYSLPETHYFNRAKPRLRRYFSWPMLSVRSCLRNLYANLGFSKKIPYFKWNYADPLVELLDWKCLQEGKSVWVEKTPSHIFHIKDIENTVERPVFIHIIRKGEDNIASLYDATNRHAEKWGGGFGLRSKLFKGYSLKKCASIWNRAIDVTSKKMSSSNHYVIVYEHIIDNPKNEIRKLCNFIGLEFQERMLDTTGAASRVTAADEMWKGDVGKEIHRPADRFSMFSAEEQNETLGLLQTEIFESIISRVGK